MMRITNHIWRIGIFPKSDGIFRLHGQEEGKFHYLTGNEFVLGSSKETEFPLAGQGIIERHLKVTLKDREIWVESLGSAPNTFVSGKLIPPKEPFPYKSGELIQLGTSNHLFNLEIFSRFLEAPVEAEAVVAEGLRQVEEKSRKAIEESHARAKGVLQQAKAEAETLINEGKGVATGLVESAKSEVDILLQQGHRKAEKTAQEGEARKNAALQSLEELKKEIAEIEKEKSRFVEETSQCKVDCDEAVQRRQNILRQTEESQNQHSKLSEDFKNFQAVFQSSQKEWEIRLGTLREEEKSIEEQMRTSQNLKNEADSTCQHLKAQAQDLEKQIETLLADQLRTQAEVKKAADEKAQRLGEIESLKHRYETDLAQLRTKVDDEYKRQLKTNAAYFQELREKEDIVQLHRHKSLERLEAKRLQRQIMNTHERLWKMISERAVLFGLDGLKDNADFKNDLEKMTALTMTEEFDLRRRELLATFPSPKMLIRRKRFNHGVTRFAGWVVSLLLLGFIIYGPGKLLESEQKISSLKTAETQRVPASGGSHFGVNTSFGH